MNNFAKIIVVLGLCTIGATTWVASRQGWGLPGLRDPQTLKSVDRDCPAYQKDQYGNCPPRNHRRRIGARNSFDGGGK